MSLWTPDGEHPVDQGRSQEPAPVGDDHGSNYDDLDPEAAARVQEQLAQAQAQLLAAPVDQVVSNHVMGLFELAALHLRVEDPDLEAARLPIDAMGLLVDNLGDRLADHDTLASALTQLRMAYVEVKKHFDAAGADPGSDEGGETTVEEDDVTDGDVIESDFLQ